MSKSLCDIPAPTVLPEGRLKRIHVYGQRIRSYRKTKVNEPCFIVKSGGETYHGHMVSFGAALGRQDLENGMPGCRHARVWIETTGEVTIYTIPLRVRK
jgi:hypothetical protein